MNTLTQSLEWQSQGQGDDIVLLHGWGMNCAVWQPTVDVLSQHYRVHTVDLPGHGVNADIVLNDLNEISEILLQDAPHKAIYIGWSLGGLVATNIAVMHPERVSKLVTVASSPKFFTEDGWRGMMPKLLLDMGVKLQSNFQLTIEGFMALQTLGSPSAHQDLKALKQQVLSRPMPSKEGLLAGLEILENADLRPQLAQLSMPFLRLYGRLDGIVPRSVAEKVKTLAPQSDHYMFQSSSHAPFMTEPTLFCEKLLTFLEKSEGE